MNELQLQAEARKILRQLKIKYIYNSKTHKTYKDNDKTQNGKPDLTVLINGNIIFIEFKTEKGLLKPDQLQWRDALIDGGYKYYLIRDITRFYEVIEEYK